MSKVKLRIEKMTKKGEREREKSRQREDSIITIHDEDFGEENVQIVDSEWADFEKCLR